MKRWFCIITILLLSLPVAARHVAGGELFYQYLGPGPATSNGVPTSQYLITLRLFRDCNSSGPVLENEAVFVGIYKKNILINTLSLPIKTAVRTISLNTAAFPCLVGNVSVCYQIGIYSETVVLEDNAEGYDLSRTGCCRVDRISNLSVPLNVGSNYVARIPGTLALPVGHNNSPQFFIRDTALVCASKQFYLDFGASDADHDSLTFALCDAYTSGSSSGAEPTPTLSLTPLPYNFPYSGSSPLGAAVSINAKTGIISGIAPPEGSYVVNVCITEWRNGVAFSEHRKDFILKVQNCDFIQADLPDKTIKCDDFNVHFENRSTSAAITSYLWDLGTTPPTTSTDPVVNFTYADTGRYMASLTVTGPNGCVGSDTTMVLVYPGFKPGFTITGSCYQNPFQFTDATTAKYGSADTWLWDFGIDSTLKDTSTLQNPKYTYPSPGTRNISLIVTSSKGCVDSLKKDLVVNARPPIQLPFKDTLICSIDTLSIPITNAGVFSWLPNKDIINANTSNPSVFPKKTTKYFVTVVDNGCDNTDSLTVNVLDFITVSAGKDSILCATDTFRLKTVSAALNYRWSSSTGEVIQNIKYPLVQPSVSTQYYVTGNLGKCQDRDTVFFKVIPYPIALAGPDTSICFGSRIQFNAVIKGSSFLWAPAGSLSNVNILNPVAIPSKTTLYTLTVRDTIGCTKPFIDSILVTVIPPVIADAGKDTSILVNQPFQLNATGGIRYAWSPETGLSNPSIANPIVTLDDRFDSVNYRVRVFASGGCYADDFVLIKVFKTGPDIFVPTAFTPNGDGRNDILKPVTVGISTLKYFNIYNRWGQLMFTTSEIGKGWDGYYGGVQQPGATYVFEVQGVDYLGKLVFRKGTTVLIR